MALRIPTAHNYCVISACSRVRAHTQHNIQILMVALALRETNHHFFFLGNKYWDLTIFLFSLNSEIAFFLYSEYGPISIAE